MASIIKHGSGYRALVARKGVRKTKIFATRKEAKEWAAKIEYEILHGEKIAVSMKLGDLFKRYAREVSPGKRGHRWEVIRLEKFLRDTISQKTLPNLTAQDFANWRDRRLQEVSPGSVRREMVLMSAVMTVARKEWGLIGESPLADVRKPSPPPPRDRLPTDDEIEALSHVAGDDLSFDTARAFHAFLFAGETAMRAGEIVGLTRDSVDLKSRVVELPRTKNGSARSVPLSSAAVTLLEALPECDPVFGLTSSQLDSLWRKVRDKAGIKGLTFHDSRAWALTKLARKVDVMTLAKISGHRDLNMLLNTYYRETAQDIARRLD